MHVVNIVEPKAYNIQRRPSRLSAALHEMPGYRMTRAILIQKGPPFLEEWLAFCTVRLHNSVVYSPRISMRKTSQYCSFIRLAS